MESDAMGMWVSGMLLLQSARSEVVRFAGTEVGAVPAGWQ